MKAHDSDADGVPDAAECTVRVMPCTDRAPESASYAVTVPNRVESIRLAAGFLVEAARLMHVSPASDSLFEVAIVEALSNAVRHGNAERRPAASIVCEMELEGRRLTVRVLDQGQGFVLSSTSAPEWSEDDVSTVPDHGFGIPIIQRAFSTIRTIGCPGDFGVEMALTF